MGSLAEMKKVLSNTTASKATSSFSSQKSETVATNADASSSILSAFMSTYVQVISKLCTFDEKMIAANEKLLVDGLFPEERFVSLNSAMFICNNFMTMVGMLILDFSGFRSFIVDGIGAEINLDALPISARKAERHKQQVVRTLDKDHCMEIGYTSFSNDAWVKMYDALQANFSQNSKLFGDAINNAMAKHTQDDDDILGFVFSSYVYIIRAINNNNIFFNGLIDYVNKAKAFYKIA